MIPWKKLAPKGVIDQIGESLSCIIHASSKAKEDAIFFIEKWDIKMDF
jgi:hypothetical protein